MGPFCSRHPGTSLLEECPHFRGGEVLLMLIHKLFLGHAQCQSARGSTVYRGVLVNGVGKSRVPLYTEVSLFMELERVEFHCIQRCPRSWSWKE